MRAPSFKELMKQNGRGDSDWRDQCVSGFPMLGELGEPGAFPPSPDFSGILARSDLFQAASSRFVAPKGGEDPKAEEIWDEAISQTFKNWLDGPYRCTPTGELWVNGELVSVNPAFRFVAKPLGRLRTVDDLKRSATNAATLVKTPTNFPSWDHSTQTCMLFGRKRESRPRGRLRASSIQEGR